MGFQYPKISRQPRPTVPVHRLSGGSGGTHTGMNEHSEDRGGKAALTFVRLPLLIIAAVVVLGIVYLIVR